jgi:hypothetical protein
MRKLIILLLLLYSAHSFGQSASAFPSSYNDDYYGAGLPTNPGNAYADDGAVVVFPTVQYGYASIIYDHFGFSIPASTIDSIKCEVEYKMTYTSGSGPLWELVYTGEYLVANGYFLYNVSSSFTTQISKYMPYDIMPTYSEVNRTDFGFSIYYEMNGYGVYEIDYVKMYIYYTASGGGGVAISKVNSVSQASISKVNTVTSSTGINKINGVANK